jgi:hypothetical protein
VRVNSTAAFATGHFCWRIVEVPVVKWSAGATVATALEELSVHVGFCAREEFPTAACQKSPLK